MNSLSADFLNRLSELGKFTIKPADQLPGYHVQIDGLGRGFWLTSFSDDQLFRCLVALQSQIAIRDKWYED